MNAVELDLTQAAKIYGIANTPLFLIRKLQEDPSVRAISAAYSGPEIVEALRSMVAAEPVDAGEAVRPYALLVALWFKTEIDHLQEAAKLETAIYAWYSYIAEVLVASFSPVNDQVIEVPGQLSSPTASIESSSPTASQYIIVP
jgi:hypothetical protein